MGKNSRVWIFIFFAVLAGNVFLRLLPTQMPQLKERAKAKVTREIFGEIKEELQKDYAFVPLSLRLKMAEVIVRGEKQEPGFEEKVLQAYDELKGKYQDEQGRFYLYGADSYAWLRATRQVLERGYPGTRLRAGRAYDSFILAPQGRQQAREQFLFYSSAFLYRLSVLLAPQLSLEQFLFYLPVFFSAIFLICVYLFCSHFFTRRAAVFASFFIGFSPIVLMRSGVGWFDSDMLNVLFPLAVVWCIAAAILSKKTSGNIIFSLLGGICLGLFSYTWAGWWFIFLVMYIFFMYSFLNTVLLNHERALLPLAGIRPLAISCLVFSLSSIVFCLLLSGYEPFSSMISSIRSNIGLGRALGGSIWPDVYSLVVELQPGSRLYLAKALGSHFILTLGVASALIMYLYYRQKQKSAVVVPLLFWFFCMFAIALQAQRFAFFVAVPIGIFLGLGLEHLFEFTAEILKTQQKTSFRFGIIACILLVVFGLCFSLVRQGSREASSGHPLLSDDFASVCVRINQQTPPQSIINTWWDYGNWVKEIARRRVLFDPQSQNRPVTYWFSRALMAQDEVVAVRILRMLNNSSDTLFDKLNTYMNDPFKAVALLSGLISSGPQKASQFLEKYHLPEALSQELKESVFFKQPAPAYLVLTKDMLAKVQAISYIANWDFSKVFIVQNRNKPRQAVMADLQALFFLSAAQAQALYKQVHYFLTVGDEDAVVSERWRIGPFFASGSQKDSLVYFDNGLLLDLESLRVTTFSAFEGKYKQFKYTYCVTDGTVIDKKHQEYDIESQALCVKDQDGWRAMGVSVPQLSRSLLVRLSFIREGNIKYFEPFLIDDKKGVYVYKINWE